MKQDLQKAFYERFRSLILPGETQTKMGERLGLTRNTIAQYYNGKRVPDAPTLCKICDACNVSADWLLGLSEVPMPDADIQAVSKYTGLKPEALNGLKKMHPQVINCILSHNDTILEMQTILVQIGIARMFYEHLKDDVPVPGQSSEWLNPPDMYRVLASRHLDKIFDSVFSMDDPFEGHLEPMKVELEVEGNG